MRGVVTGEEVVVTDHEDSYFDMVSRKVVNEVFASRPKDFNLEGLRAAKFFTSLEESDRILDIGCSSGQFILEAAQKAGIKSRLIGLDPDPELVQFLPDDVDTSRFTFLEGKGEDIPLPDNSVQVVAAHNVIFRAANVAKMLAEMKRVTKPNGLVVISSNFRSHATYRHDFEEMVADLMSVSMRKTFDPPVIPAEKCYFEDLPKKLAEIGELRSIGEEIQGCDAVITRDRVNAYMTPILFSFNRTNLPESRELRSQWRQTVRKVVEPYIEHEIDTQELENQVNGSSKTPYFADIIHRGMIVARNSKAS
jgi:ubiquinone/menaquinone biosynthesis C-methylase UbiE